MKKSNFLVSALALAALGISTTANAQSILDNTLNGTRGFSGTGNGIVVGAGFRRGYIFTVGSGDTLNLSSVKVGLEKSGSVTASLYNWDSTGITTSGGVLASQLFSVTSPVDNNDHYYDFNLTGSGWTGVGPGNYAFVFENATNTLLADKVNIGNMVTNGVTGYTEYVFTPSSSIWNYFGSFEVLFQLNGTVTSGTSGGGGAVPEPGEWAAMGIFGAGLAGLVIRKRRQA